MFVKQVNEIVKKDKRLNIGEVIQIELESKEKTNLKIIAINGELLTLEEVKNAGSIFIFNFKEHDIRSIILNKPQKVVQVSYVETVTGQTKPIKADMTYIVESKKVKETEIVLGDTFYFNNSQLCEVVYLSEDKSLMVVKYVISGKEIPVLHTDVIWLRNTKIKGRV